MYPLAGRYKKMCDLYRSMKLNYVSIYLNVSAYSYTADSGAAFSADLVPSTGKTTDKLFLNVSQIGSMIGCDKFCFAWNLEGLMHE